MKRRKQEILGQFSWKKTLLIEGWKFKDGFDYFETVD